jgi:hypothetical protein
LQIKKRGIFQLMIGDLPAKESKYSKHRKRIFQLKKGNLPSKERATLSL